MNDENNFSPDPSEIVPSYPVEVPRLIPGVLLVIPSTHILAAGDEPLPGVSYTPRITRTEQL